jgi:hypothetical protein
MLTFLPSALRVAGRLSVILVLSSAFAWAKDWDALVENLAAKISAVTGQSPISFDLVNRSSLDHSEVEIIRRAFIDKLSASGLRFANSEQSTANVKVSLSENLSDYVWIAEIRRGANDPVMVMISMQRANAASTSHDALALMVRKTLLWSSDEQVLDADTIHGTSSRMVVLYSNQVKLYKLQIDRWMEEQTLSISHSQPWPRDLRGRLVLRQDRFEAHLPGVLCHSLEFSAINCRVSNDPWPVGIPSLPLNSFYAESRNFFTGGLSPGVGKQTTAPAFYSLAPIPREKYTLWFVAAAEGRVHVLDGTNDSIVPSLDWGTEIVTVRSKCGSGWQILATRSGAVQQDIVQAFEVADRQPLAVGQPAELSGGVTSLWTSADESGAIAVVRNFQTGKYEVYLLTINCGL